MNNHIISTITLGLSVLFFLVAGALTVAPLTNASETSSDIKFSESIEIIDAEMEISSCTTGCCTCDDIDCTDASFCGMDGRCESGSEICQMSGGLCGPDCGLPGEN